MRRTGWTIACVILLLASSGCGWLPSPSVSTAPAPPATQQTPTPLPSASESSPSPSTVPTPTSSPEDEVETQVNAMTLEEKVGQMLMAGVKGTSADSSAKRMITEDHVGGIILFKNNLAAGMRSSVDLINGLKQANAVNSAPLFMSVDQEGGRVNRLPKDFVPMPPAGTVGKTGNTKAASQMGALIANELKLLGFNMDFAPVLDINSNPKNPVIGDRAFGTTADNVTDLGIAAMLGLRGGGIIPVVKHFPGHGDTSVDSHLDLPVVDKTTDDLERMEWLPFKAAIDAQAEAVMVAHILFPSIDPNAPASLSKIIIRDHLRGKLGFRGVVITDDLTMGAIAKNYGIAEAALKSVEAGSDILLMAHGYETAHQVYQALLDNVKSGRLPESRIDESVTRILKLKRSYALSDGFIRVPDNADLPNDAVRAWLKDLKAAVR